MPKRKREDDVGDVFFRFRNELHHALKVAKGFERQRQSKRLRDPEVPAEKKARIEKEVAVLKSLDLHQAAHAHLCSTLLRIRSIAESPKLPAEIKAGIPKPELTEEEKVALHNVTSSLSSRQEVRDASDKAIAGICKALGLPVPEKKLKGKKPAEEKALKDGKPKEEKKEQIPDSDEEERAIAELDDLLNSSSGEENSGAEGAEEARAAGAARAAKTTTHRRADPLEGLDPMEITDEEADSEDGRDESELDAMAITSDEDEGDGGDRDDDSDAGSDSASESSEFQGFSDAAAPSPPASDGESSSEEPSPPPIKARKAKAAPSHSAGSTFLPTLMGGYVSGSDSEASDIDITPQTHKNRRGQRARQVIWEKRYKAEAKHLKKKQQQGRDSGWDPKRGAVDGEAGKPWNRGIRNPLVENSDTGGNAADEKKAPPPRKRDDTGPLHPSWEAKRKAKEAQKASAPFQGKRITFD